MFYGRALDRKPGKLLPADYALILGLQMYEDSLCSECRQPSWLSYNPRNTGEFERRDDICCEACALNDQARESDRPTIPGEKHYIHNRITDS